MIGSRKVCRKFATKPKKLSLIKNLHFCSDQADIQPISPTHEVIILTKFHNVRVKTVGFLEIAKFWLSSKFLTYLSSVYSLYARWTLNMIDITFNVTFAW